MTRHDEPDPELEEIERLLAGRPEHAAPEPKFEGDLKNALNLWPQILQQQIASGLKASQLGVHVVRKPIGPIELAEIRKQTVRLVPLSGNSIAGDEGRSPAQALFDAIEHYHSLYKKPAVYELTFFYRFGKSGNVPGTTTAEIRLGQSEPQVEPRVGHRRVRNRELRTKFVGDVATRAEVDSVTVKKVLSGLLQHVHETLLKSSEILVPGLVLLKVVKGAPTPARKGVNPFTKEETHFAARPARLVVRALASRRLNRRLRQKARGREERALADPRPQPQRRDPIAAARTRAEISERIIAALGRVDEPVGIRDISKAVGLPLNALAASLKELQTSGRIQKRGKTKGAVYSLVQGSGGK